MSALSWVLAAPAGALGALARLGTGRLMARGLGLHAPWGVLAVNIVGTFLFGVLVGLNPGHGLVLILGAGFLGSYTTFSTWMAETEALAVDRRWNTALLNLVVPAAGGLVVGTAGFTLGLALA
ncbi:MAG: fluoride efflux transporter CrcB [Actinobacteria bacterium]|nr:fluoride efflux transporter CrcB [Actinomycetota bacterium]MBM3697748.1 fluoride efflux transporter CrcB [Actinomycetota bacterium]